MTVKGQTEGGEVRTVTKYGALLVALAGLILVLLPHRFPVKSSRESVVSATGGRGGAVPSSPERALGARALESYGKLPLSFEANQGQTDRRVKFLSRGSGYSLFLTGNDAVLALRKKSRARGQKSGVGVLRPKLLSPAAATESSFADLPRYLPPSTEWLKDSFVAHREDRIANLETQIPPVLRMKLVGANPHERVSGLEQLPGKSNYFIGNDPRKWRTNVPNYAKVKYASVYPGVDLVYYGNQGQLEYDFIVQPGADPRQITLDVGADLVPAQGHPRAVPLHLAENGDLVVGTDGGEVVFHKPVVYEPATDGRTTNDQGQRTKDKHFVNGNYVLNGNRLTFEVATYDRTRPLVIDPVLAYSTYLGGSDLDQGIDIAVDVSGSAYVAGLTSSTDFPTVAGAFQTTIGGGEDVFVSKLNAAGSALLYSTYVGGSSNDQAGGIAVDASGSAYVVGSTSSANFPTTQGAFQTLYGGNGDAFVSKLNAAGSALLYSTFLGGTGQDEAAGVTVDALGNVYVTGATAASNELGCLSSNNFPTTPGAFQTTYNGACGDAFVSKLNPVGSALVYSTYLGGNSRDFGSGLAVDGLGNAYVTGGIGNTHVTGGPYSFNFPTTPGAFQTSPGTCTGSPCGDAFVTKLNPAGSALVYSTYLGGSGDFGSGNPAPSNRAAGIVIDDSGNAYIVGSTTSPNFPTTPGAFLTSDVISFGCDAFPCSAVFISKLNATGSALIYSTYLTGNPTEQGAEEDFGQGIAVDASGDTWVVGITNTYNGTFSFPTTPGAIQTSGGGYVTKLNAIGSGLLYSTYIGGNEGGEASGVAVDASGNAYVTGDTSSSDFPTTPAAFQTILRGQSDAFISKFSFGIPFSNFSGKLELDPDAGSFDLNASFTLGPGGSINPPTQPVSLTIGTYSVTIPARSFVRHTPGYAFEGVINGVSLEVLIKFGSMPGSYSFLAEARGANLAGTTNPVMVTLSIGDNTGSTEINADFQ